MPALPAHELAESVSFVAVTTADFDMLLSIRIAAMCDSLERIGRFDPARARARLLETFEPAVTRLVELGGQPVGFYAFRRAADGFHLDHLYILPAYQGRGVGAFVLARLFAIANAERLPIYAGALVGSDSNHFYQRHGFVKLREEEWDVYYIRPIGLTAHPPLNVGE